MIRRLGRWSARTGGRRRSVREEGNLVDFRDGQESDINISSYTGGHPEQKESIEQGGSLEVNLPVNVGEILDQINQVGG